MKNTLLITSTIISLLGLIGCSNFEDTTSVGSQLIQEADPSFLDFDKNYKPFSLNTSIVTDSKSIPDQNAVNFGVHVSNVLPVGGKNGEVSTAYYQFKPSISNWQSFRNIDTLADSTNIFSSELILYKADSLNSVCDYNQEVNLIFAEDSSYKYNRSQLKVDEFLAAPNSTILSKLDFSKLKLQFSDTAILTKKIREVCSFKRKEYSELKKDDERKLFRDTLKLPSLNFVIASKDTNKNYALMSGSAALKVHFYKGDYSNSKVHKIKDTIIPLSDYTFVVKDSTLPGIIIRSLLRDTSWSRDTLLNVKKDSLLKKDSLPVIVAATPRTDTLPHKIDTLPQLKSTRRVKSDTNTLVIDTMFFITKTASYLGIHDTTIQITTSSYIRVDSLIDSIVHKADSIDYICRTWHYKIDSILSIPKFSKKAKIDSATVITLDTITMIADSLFIPLSYSNYVMYETKETLERRANPNTNPISSFGPQRTAVFELNLDSLWNTLKLQPTATQPAFNKILSAGVAITGKLDSSFKSSMMSDTTDTTISVRWFVSESKDLMNDGLQLHKTDKYIGRIDTLKNGVEAVLPIEKNLQEILSRTPHPPRVYLYLEPLSSKNFNKQVTWSKPSLITVLTTSTKK